MPQIGREEFERLQPRVHAFLAGVPLHEALPSTCRARAAESRMKRGKPFSYGPALTEVAIIDDGL